MQKMQRGEGSDIHSIVGTFRDEAQLERAVRDLKNEGFFGEDITLSAKDEGQAGRLSERWGIVDAKTSPRWLEGGNMLLGVDCGGNGDRCDVASRVLSRAGAKDVRPARINIMEEHAREVQTFGAEGRRVEGEVIPVREEQLSAHKERHKEGEVEVTKRVVERERTMRIPVTHEEVEIERRHVEGPADRGPQEGSVTIPVYEEEIVLEKRPRLVEEIRISKRPVTEEKEVRGTVRKEIPEIRRHGDLEERAVREREVEERERREQR